MADRSGQKAKLPAAQPSFSLLDRRRGRDNQHHFARRGQPRRRGTYSPRAQEKQHRQRGRRRPRRRRGARLPLCDPRPLRPRHLGAPSDRPARPQSSKGRRPRGLAKDSRRRENEAFAGRDPDIVEGRARPRRELRPGRQQLRAQARGLHRVRGGRAPAGALLARSQRIPAGAEGGLAMLPSAAHGPPDEAVALKREAERAPLRVLHIEDSEDDSALVMRELERGGFNPVCQRVETGVAFKAALQAGEWDVIISDYSLPKYDGLTALEDLRSWGKDIPFILVSGTIGEAGAVNAMRAGAQDYVLKA